jgi:sugar lactone lactonase YvrE
VLLLPHAASAAPDCAAGQPPPRALITGKGTLESVIVDDGGRLFYTDVTAKALMRVDRPGADPVKVAGDIDSPGGLAFDGSGKLLVGYGDAFENGGQGNIQGQAGLLRIDPNTGAKTTYATGTQMSNGVVRAADGTVFASSDAGVNGIDRVSPSGQVQRAWAQVVSANGLAIDSTGRFLYAAQTFQPAAIARVEIAHPANVETYARPGPEDISAGPDGMTIDDRDRLFVAANGGGQIWRVNTDRSICALARGLLLPSAVAFGHGSTGFSARNLYAVTFSGQVIEIAGAGKAAGPADAVRPVISAVSVSRRNRTLRFRLSEPADVHVTVAHRGARARAARTLHGRAGRNAMRLRGLCTRRARRCAYRVRLRATDPAGNRSHQHRKDFSLKPPR